MRLYVRTKSGGIFTSKDVGEITLDTLPIKNEVWNSFVNDSGDVFVVRTSAIESVTIVETEG